MTSIGHSGRRTLAIRRLTPVDLDDPSWEASSHRGAAIVRAEKRLEDGTYGRSVQSGAVIPDDRLEADPAAELTFEEAALQK